MDSVCLRCHSFSGEIIESIQGNFVCICKPCQNLQGIDHLHNRMVSQREQYSWILDLDEEQTVCPSCGSTSSEIEQNGLAACPTCYESHYLSIQNLRKLTKVFEYEKIVKTFLNQELQIAIFQEDFEWAGILRDKIQ